MKMHSLPTVSSSTSVSSIEHLNADMRHYSNSDTVQQSTHKLEAAA